MRIDCLILDARLAVLDMFQNAESLVQNLLRSFHREKVLKWNHCSGLLSFGGCLEFFLNFILKFPDDIS